MIIPDSVSGRPVTNRGVHLPPTGHHGGWCREQGDYPRSYWLDLMKSMQISWAVLLTDGDSVLEVFDGKTVLEWLLGAGIIPVVRYYALLPRPFVGHSVVERALPIYDRYGLRPFWQLWNEPFNSREWVSGYVPPDAWYTFTNLYNQAANDVLNLGGWPGFPDGPDYDFVNHHPFRDTIWDDGCWYGAHPYARGRDRDYPMDPVTTTGEQLTLAAYMDALDDFWMEQDWMEVWVEGDEALTIQLSLDTINTKRLDPTWMIPNPVLWDGQRSDYTTCWQSWKLVEYHALQALGYCPPLIVTECGWTPRDRPGEDGRMPYTTPRRVARETLAMFESESRPDSPFLGICPWILADEDMGGSGWPFEAWHGWAYSELYGRQKPVIQALQSTTNLTTVRNNTEQMLKLLCESQEILDAIPTDTC